MPTATEILQAACASGISCLSGKNLLVAIAQGASAGGGGGGGGGTLSTDGTFAANSDLLYPSQKAAKTYIDNAIATAGGLYVLKAGDTMTGALLLPNGAVGAPSLSHAADANTGLWFPAADTVAFSTAGLEQVRITANGFVGFGTSSPTTRISVMNGDYVGFRNVANNGEAFFFGANGANAGVMITSGYATPIALDASSIQLQSNGSTGRVSIGNTSPLAKLHITPTASGTDYFRIDHSDGTPRLQMGALTGSVTLGAIWFGGIVPSATNYGLASDGATLRVGSPIAIPSGSNQRAGNATLVGGTLTVLNTTVTANTIVLLTRKSTGGTIGFAVTYTVIAATSFTITSDNVLDTSTYSYLLIEVP